MKRIVVLLMLLLIVPPVTALAASVTSKSFVVRNWMATLPTTPASTDEVDEFETDGVETEASVADTFIPPELGSTPASTTPAFTDEVEQGEQGKPGEVEQDDHSEPGEQPIPPAFTDVVETEGQPATPIFTTPVSPDEGEQGKQDEQGEFVGEAEEDEHSEEVDEPGEEMK